MAGISVGVMAKAGVMASWRRISGVMVIINLVSANHNHIWLSGENNENSNENQQCNVSESLACNGISVCGAIKSQRSVALAKTRWNAKASES